MPAITATTDGVIITCKVQPRASTNAIAGADGEWIRVRLQAPPVDGKANAALTAFLAKTLGCARREITIVSGDTSRLKRLRVSGCSAADAAARLGLK